MISLTSLKTLFVLKCQESCDGSIVFLEVLSLEFINLVVNLSHLVVLLKLNGKTTLLQEVNQLGIIESECDH